MTTELTDYATTPTGQLDMLTDDPFTAAGAGGFLTAREATEARAATGKVRLEEFQGLIGE